MWQSTQAEPGRSDLVVMVRGGVEPGRQMAARAHRAGRRGRLEAVRVVAVAARHARPVHAGLQKRSVLVDLAEDLAIGVVELGVEQRRPVGIEQGATVDVAVVDQTAPRVAPRAALHLEPGGRGPRPAGDSRGRVHLPGGVAMIAKADGQAQRAIARQAARALRRSRPLDVTRAGPVARLAPDVELEPRGLVPVVGGPIVLEQIGGVAFRAHVVPRLVAPRPVQRIAGPGALGRVQIEPALPALRLGTRVPGEVQRLVPPSRAARRGTAVTAGRRTCRRSRSRRLWPFGPSVRTNGLSSRQRNVDLPPPPGVGLPKSASTVRRSAGCMARS